VTIISSGGAISIAGGVGEMVRGLSARPFFVLFFFLFFLQSGVHCFRHKKACAA